MPRHKPFAPWLYTLGASIRQASLSELASDAALMAAAAIDTSKLMDTPSVCLSFDLPLWAEAAGCSIDWSESLPVVTPGGSTDPNPDRVRDSDRIITLLKANERVKGALPQRPVTCAIPGPAALAQYLNLAQSPSRMDQFAVGELLTEFVTVLCENSFDHILVVEPQGFDDASLAPWLDAKHYGKIAKLAGHYNIKATLLCPSASLDGAQLAQFDALDAIIGQPLAIAPATLSHAEKGLPVLDFGSGNARVSEAAERLEPGSYFLTTDADLAVGCDIAAVQQDAATIRAFLQSGTETSR